MDDVRHRIVKCVATAAWCWVALGSLGAWPLSVPAPSAAFAQLPADRSELAFLDELERRQWFGPVIRHCQRHFSDESLPPGYRSHLAARWIRSLTLATLNAEDSTDADPWEPVRQVAQRLSAETRFFPQHALVRFQASLIGLAEARLSSLLPGNGQSIEIARQRGLAAVRDALEELRQLQLELEQKAAAASPRSNNKNDFPEFSREQLQALSRDVEYQILAALAIRSRFYNASESASRDDTSLQILELGGRLQPRLSNESTLWWETQAQMLEAYRGLQEWNAWQVKWDNGPLGLAPNETLGKVTAARLEMLLDQENLPATLRQAEDFFVLLKTRDPEAIGDVAQISDLDHVTAWPEWDLARARLFLELAAAADRQAGNTGDRPDSARWGAEAQILEFSRAVGQRHGGYWSGELTRRLLGRSANNDQAAPVSLLLIRQRISDGQWEEVQTLTLRGIQQASAADNPDLANELAVLVAGMGRLIPPQAWMVRAIESATLTFPTHPQSGRNHYFACILAGQILKQDPSYQNEAVTVWQSHIGTWPKLPTADKTRRQLAAIFLNGQQFEEAANALNAIDLDSPEFAAAVPLLQTVFERYLGLPDLLADDATAIAEHWAQTLKLRLEEDGQWIGQWTLPRKQLALLAIQLQLQSSRPKTPWISPLLQIISERLPDLDPPLKSRTTAITLLHEFQQDTAVTPTLEALKQGQATILPADGWWLLNTLSRELPPWNLALLSSTPPAAAGNRSGRLRLAAEIQLSLLEKLPSPASAPEQAWATQQRIQALLHLERIPEALAAAQKAAADQPRSLPHQQWLGYCLSRSNDPADAADAERQWRKIGFLTREGTTAWVEAKYFLADAQRRGGDNQSAEKLLRYFKATQPQTWESSEFRGQLERLLQSVTPR